MVLDPAIAAAFVVPLVGVTAWGAHMEFRLRGLERQSRSIEAYQRIILRGLVRMRVVTQEELDDVQQKLDDTEERREARV